MESVQLASLLIVALAALLVPVLFALVPRFPIPILVGEMAAGIALGRSGLGWIHVGPWLQFLDLFGLAYLLFLAGTEVDFRLMRLPLGRGLHGVLDEPLGSLLGRRFARPFLNRRGRFSRHRRKLLACGERFFARHGTKAVFLGRWLPFARMTAAWLAGATRMRWRTFAAFNALGASGGRPASAAQRTRSAPAGLVLTAAFAVSQMAGMRPDAAQRASRSVARGVVERALRCGSMWSHMREQIGIRELRDRLTATIRRVRDGETIEITHHHRPVAVLAPVRADRIDRLLEASDVEPAEPLDRPLRRFSPTGAVTATGALEDDRAER